MSAAELLDTLNRAGATIEMVDGKPRLRGARISDELKEALKSQRQAVMEEFQRRRTEGRDRWGKVPPPDAPMTAGGMSLNADEKRIVLLHVMAQPRPVHAWVMLRAAAYHAQCGSGPDDCDWRACVDAIAWQRGAVGLPTDWSSLYQSQHIAVPKISD